MTSKQYENIGRAVEQIVRLNTMNLLIKVIDGVAYAVERIKIDEIQHPYYRSLTAEEREELIKAIGRGME